MRDSSLSDPLVQHARTIAIGGFNGSPQRKSRKPPTMKLHRILADSEDVISTPLSDLGPDEASSAGRVVAELEEVKKDLVEAHQYIKVHGILDAGFLCKAALQRLERLGDALELDLADADTAAGGGTPATRAPAEQLMVVLKHAIDLAEQAARASSPKDVLRKLYDTIEGVLNPLIELGLDTEHQLLDFPNMIVGVGYPGNEQVDDATGMQDDQDYVCQRRVHPLHCWLKGLELSARPEWCMRVAMSAILSVSLVMNPAMPKSLIYGSVWIPVLAIAGTKPTLGDALEFWWIAVSGGAFGILLTFALLPIAVLSDVAAVVCMTLTFFLIVLAFGDHVQARWAMLPTLAAFSNPQNAVKEAACPFLGFFIGGMIATVSLMLPFPCMATYQAQRRLTEAYRQVMRLHAVLVVAMGIRESSKVLENRMSVLCDSIEGSLRNLRNLVEVAGWEFMICGLTTRKHVLEAHIEHLTSLASNTIQRKHQFQTMKGPQTSLNCLDDGALNRPSNLYKNKYVLVTTHKAARLLRHAAADLLGEPTPSVASIRKEHAELATAHNQMMAKWANSLQASSLRAVDCEKVLPMAEQYLLLSDFNALIMKFPYPKGVLDEDTSLSKAAKSWKLSAVEALRHLFPGAFDAWITKDLSDVAEHTNFKDKDGSRSLSDTWLLRRRRLFLAARTALMLLVATQDTIIPAFNTTKDAYDPDDPMSWSASNLIQNIPVFCPITVIFIFQSRYQTLIPKHSRAWRWLLGTYMSCQWSLWTMFVSEGAPPQLVAFLALLCVCGTWVHSNEVFEYAGLVAAFTAPIIVVPLVVPTLTKADVWNDRASARMSQSYLGACIVAFLSYLSIFIPGDSARTLLDVHLCASIRAMRGALEGLNDVDASNYKDIVKNTREALHGLPEEIKHMEGLLAEADDESFLYTPWNQKPLSVTDYRGAVRGLEGSLRSTLLMWYYLETPSSTSSSEASRDEQPSANWLAAFATFRERGQLIWQPMTETLGHILDSFDQKVGVETAVPEALFELQSRTDAFWQSLSEDWGEVLSKLMPDLTDESVSNKKMRSMRTRAASPTSFEKADMQGIQSFMTMCALLGHLRKLSHHTASIAWRTANIIDKANPSKSFIPAPTDMYRNKLVI